MYLFRDTIKEYLECIKNIQDCITSGMVPYTLEQKRVGLHNKIAKYLDCDSTSKYEALKEIFSNMDIICKIYSECDEWKLETERDIKMMSQYLEYFLTSAECRLYLEGKVSSLFNLHCIKNVM